MRAFLAALILFLTPLCAEPIAAQASPLFLHALSDSELAANSAGRGVAIQFRETAQNNQITVAGLEADPAWIAFGIETISHDSGTASFTQAITSVAVRATLTSNAPRAGL